MSTCIQRRVRDVALVQTGLRWATWSSFMLDFCVCTYWGAPGRNSTDTACQSNNMWDVNRVHPQNQCIFSDSLTLQQFGWFKSPKWKPICNIWCKSWKECNACAGSVCASGRRFGVETPLSRFRPKCFFLFHHSCSSVISPTWTWFIMHVSHSALTGATVKPSKLNLSVLTCRLSAIAPPYGTTEFGTGRQDCWPFLFSSRQKLSGTTSAFVELRLPQSACHVSVNLVFGDAVGPSQTCRCFATN